MRCPHVTFTDVLFTRPVTNTLNGADLSAITPYSVHNEINNLVAPFSNYLAAQDRHQQYQRVMASPSTERLHGVVRQIESAARNHLNLGCGHVNREDLSRGIPTLLRLLSLTYRCLDNLLVETLITMESTSWYETSTRLLSIRLGGTVGASLNDYAFLARAYALGAASLTNFIRIKSSHRLTTKVAYLRACDILATEWTRFANAALIYGAYERHLTLDASIATGLILQYTRNNWAGENLDATQSLSGLAIDLAKQSGLDQDPEESTDPIHDGKVWFERRVAMLQLNNIEWSNNSLQCRRWGLDNVTEFPVKYPTDQGDTSHLAIFAAKCHLASIGENINIIFCEAAHPPSRERTMEMELQLQNADQMLPLRYRLLFDESTGVPAGNSEMTEAEIYDVYSFYLFKHSLGIRLHRGYIAVIDGVVDATQVKYHRDRLMTYCKPVFRIWARGKFTKTFALLQFAHLAAAVATAVYVLTTADGETPDPTLINHVHLASRVLEPDVKFNYALNRSYAVLISLIDKICTKPLEPALQVEEAITPLAIVEERDVASDLVTSAPQNKRSRSDDEVIVNCQGVSSSKKLKRRES